MFGLIVNGSIASLFCQAVCVSIVSLAISKETIDKKLNVASGRFDFKHGAFVDTEVMRNALKV
jgi:hypothetical protein